jgi:hypothetical protein
MLRLLTNFSLFLLLTQYAQQGWSGSVGTDYAGLLGIPPVGKIQQFLSQKKSFTQEDHPALIVATEHGRVRGRLNLTWREKFMHMLGSDKLATDHPRVFSG